MDVSQLVMTTVVQSIMQTSHPPINSIHTLSYLGKPANNINDDSHPGHSLFSPLPSDRRYKSLKVCTISFFPAVITLEQTSHMLEASSQSSSRLHCSPCTFFFLHFLLIYYITFCTIYFLFCTTSCTYVWYD